MKEPTIYTYKTPEALSVVLAEKILNLIKDALIRNEDFHIAVSGGKTPEILFSSIAAKYKDPGYWDHVHFYWVDERCVYPDHPDSNFRMMNDTLLRYLTISYDQIYRIRGEDDPYAEAQRYIELIRSRIPFVNSLPCFNLVMLGVGTDGHTASIFPGNLELFDSEEYCTVTNDPVSGEKRITLTGRIINNAANIYMLVTGKDKSAIIGNLLTKSQNMRGYPAAYIRPTHGILEWFLDDPAAKYLNR
ncbi:MAG: hypothetical protein AMS27_14670 [Bacteroides sp. SM23_62_1]|nr:MAG: hypothetical protein AMS27_14670 [Bacteroides sp. SM23_62_1]